MNASKLNRREWLFGAGALGASAMTAGLPDPRQMLIQCQ